MMRYVSCAVLIGATVLPCGSALQGGELKIAVVDLQRLFMAYEKRNDLQKDLDAKKEKMNTELATIEKDLKAAQSDLEVLQPGTDSYRKKQLKLIELETLLEVSKRRFQAELERQQRAHMERLLKDLHAEIQAYATEHDTDLVLSRFFADPRLPRPHFTVLYSKAQLDITDALIRRLNAKYKKGG